MVKGERIPELHLLKNILYTTIRITTIDDKGEEDGVGTGFFYHVYMEDEHGQTTYSTVIITNKHVIEGSKRGRLVFHLGPNVDGYPTGGVETVDIEEFEDQFVFHKNPEIDICALNIDGYLKTIKTKTGKNVYYQAFSMENLPRDYDLEPLFPIEDVYMIGYPIGLWDKTNNLPISRKGVTASHPRLDFNSKPIGLVDIASFAGSSGSPIILFKTIDINGTINGERTIWLLLGILVSVATIDLEGTIKEVHIGTKKKTISVTDVMVHLGYYIKAKELFELEDQLREMS